MTAVLLFGAAAGLCLVVYLSAVPEFLAAGLTAVCILVPYDYLQGRPTVSDQSITIEQRNGQPYVTTSPLPETILMAQALYDTAEPYDPEIDGDTGLAPPPLWLEDRGIQENDHSEPTPVRLLNIEATNVAITCGPPVVQPDGNLLMEVWNWREK